MAVFFGSVVMFDLRLLGLTMPQGAGETKILGELRLLPLTIAAFVIMVISGTLLFYAIPLHAPIRTCFFRAKMLLLLLAGLNVVDLSMRASIRRSWAGMSQTRAAQGGADCRRALLTLWIAIVISGRE